MIKYAKTKDNKIVKVDVENGIFTSKYEIVGEPKNTIEELCDRYVFETEIHTTPFHRVCLIKEEAIEIYDNCKVENKTIYGAIWTEWGLKYVVKMNDKGELESI